MATLTREQPLPTMTFADVVARVERRKKIPP
jgi:hypothetical protein